MSTRSILIRCGIVLALAVAFIWPAIANRQPFFYPDTITYAREGDAIGAKVFHHPTAWSATHDTSTANTTRARSVTDAGRRGVLAGRSMYYGIFLYFGYVLGHYWSTVLIQAALILLAAYFAMRAFGIAQWKSFLLVSVGLIFVSDATFSSTMLMPDVFAGITLLGASVLVASRGQFSRTDRLLWLALLVVGCLFHDTCIALALIFLAAETARMFLPGRPARFDRFAILSVAVVAGFLGHAVFSKLIARTTGNPPLKSPFLTARLQDDGPAARYLQATCPGSGFVACQFADRMPMTSDKFLFDPPEKGGVFWSLSMADRRKLEKEQLRLAIATFRFDPVGTSKTAVRNALTQLVDFRLVEFDYPANQNHFLGFGSNLPLPVIARMRGTPAYRGTLPIHLLDALLYTFVILSLAYLLLAIVAGKHFGRAPGEILPLIVAVFFGIVMNAILCGAVSGVYPRFQSRVIWLLPMLVLFNEAQHRFRRRTD